MAWITMLCTVGFDEAEKSQCRASTDRSSEIALTASDSRRFSVFTSFGTVHHAS